ncbi:WEE/WEE-UNCLASSIFIED protein kinase [Tremella mesenterica]|uniref:WEE/WEE-UNCLASSIFIED protein kinase n=1 Tax=Tremella mesenterica TaxID=5217 RepID=A0A4Q1BW41_TREME|nr:WEE/WEE-UNCLASSIFIED protein kinase [Tremella mesenterica]
MSTTQATQVTPQSTRYSPRSARSARPDVSAFTPRRPTKFTPRAVSPSSNTTSYVHPATAPLPHISAFLGSPFSSKDPRGGLIYESVSPSYGRVANTDRLPHHHLPQHNFDWLDDSEYIDENEPQPIAELSQRRRNGSGSISSMDDSNSGASSASLRSLGRSSMEGAVRPSIVTICEGFNEDEYHDDDEDPSTPCRTLFSGTAVEDALPSSSRTACRSPRLSPLMFKRATSKTPVPQQMSPLQNFFSSRTPSKNNIRDESPSTGRKSPLSSFIPRLLSSKKNKQTTPTPITSHQTTPATLHPTTTPIRATTTSKIRFAHEGTDGGMVGLGINPSGRQQHGPSPVFKRPAVKLTPRAQMSDSGSETEISPSRPLSARTSLARSTERSSGPSDQSIQGHPMNRRKTMVGRLQGKTSPLKPVNDFRTVGSSGRPFFRRGLTDPHPPATHGTPNVTHLFADHHFQTPPAMFNDIKPSPAAFASTGLVKKKSGVNPLVIPKFDTDMRSITQSRSAAQISPTVPTRTNSPGSPLSPLKSTRPGFAIPSLPSSGRSVLTSTSSQGDLLVHAGQKSRGLRRKGSQMFTSGSVSSIGDSTRLSPVASPATPIKGLATKPSLSKGFSTVTTPSPSTSPFNYPFASVPNTVCTPPPSSQGWPESVEKTRPLRIRQLSSAAEYAEGTSHGRGPVARASNPMLAATFKADGLSMGSDSNTRPTFMLNGKEVPIPWTDRLNQEYTVMQCLGSGAFSKVWKVKDKKEGKLWAVKAGKVYTGAKNRLRQLEEVSILRQLSLNPHPSVIQFVDSWEQHSRLYLRTELLPCGDLARFLAALGDVGGLGEVRVWKSLVELSNGLKHIHSHNILHLDLKPSNILIASDGSLRIADFGMSVLSRSDGMAEGMSPALPQTGLDGGFTWTDEMDGGEGGFKMVPSPLLDREVEGDREYLCPEALKDGKLGRAADVYSLGILLLEAAVNVVLPSNGESWVKLRSDDFTDLSEHYHLRTPSSCLTTENHLVTPIKNSKNLTTPSKAIIKTIEDSTIPIISSQLLDLIKGMMRSDPIQRITLEDMSALSVFKKTTELMSPLNRPDQLTKPLAKQDEGVSAGRKSGENAVDAGNGMEKKRQMTGKALVEESTWVLECILAGGE